MADEVTTPPSEETPPTLPASEPAPAPTGAAADNDGSGGGSQTDAGSLAAEREAALQRARQEQARADRLQAELDRARQPKADPATPTPLTMEALRAEFQRRDELTATAATLRTEFPEATASVYAGEYDNAEQLRAAVENSHKANADTKAKLKAEAEAEVRARYAEQYGPLNDTPPDAGGGATGDPTPEQVARMTMAEMDALEAANPGVIDRILRSATS